MPMNWHDLRLLPTRRIQGQFVEEFLDEVEDRLPVRGGLKYDDWIKEALRRGIISLDQFLYLR